MPVVPDKQKELNSEQYYYKSPGLSGHPACKLQLKSTRAEMLRGARWGRCGESTVVNRGYQIDAIAI